MVLYYVLNRGVRVPDKFGYPMFGSGRVLVIPQNNRVSGYSTEKNKNYPTRPDPIRKNVLLAHA